MCSNIAYTIRMNPTNTYLTLHNDVIIHTTTNPIESIHNIIMMLTDNNTITTNNLLIYHTIVNLIANEPIPDYITTPTDRKMLRQCLYHLRKITPPIVTLE